MSRRDSSASKRQIRIEPGVLRDHATSDRIDRVWARLEQDVSSQDVEPPTPLPTRRRRRVTPLITGARTSMAMAASFVLGVGLAGWLWGPNEQRPVVMQPAPVQADGPRVLAAGTAPQTYPLPGGGVITLEPGTIVDIDDENQGLRLRLVRGEATVNTRGDGAHRRDRVSMMVGQARVETAAGSMRIRHDGDTAYLQIIDGSAEVSTPHGEKRDMLLGPDEEATVPVRVTTTRVDPPRAPDLAPPSEAEDDEGSDTEEEPSGDGDEPASSAAVVAAWVKACNEYDYAGAVKLFAEEGGNIAQVDNPSHLQCLSDGHRAGKDYRKAVDVLERVVNGPADDGTRMVAASDLIRLFTRLGEADKAAHYRQVFEKLSKGRLLSAEALCQKIQSEAGAGHADTVRQLAERYRSQFPNGACIPTIRQLLEQLAKAPAEAGDGDGADDPYDDVPADEEDGASGDHPPANE